MSKGKTRSPNLSHWQRTVLRDLRAIAAKNLSVLEIVSRSHRRDGTYAAITIRLPTKDLERAGNGLPLNDYEDFVVKIPPSPVYPPQVEVEHARFLGHPHVLQGYRLCIYLDQSREWNPSAGMAGFLDRLWEWLADAAAGQFNPETAMYHAVGGVLHRTAGTPTVVIREPVPGKTHQRAYLSTRTELRRDLTFSRTMDAQHVMPVITLSSDLPLGAGQTLAEMLQLLDAPDPLGYTRPRDPGRVTGRAALTALASASARNPNGEDQYFALAVPHPTSGPPHLLCGRLPAVVADQLRKLVRTHGATLDLDLATIPNIPISWCNVSDERPDITTRRDDQRPVNAFQGKTVHIWGCGGLGSWIAEFIVRAGAARIYLCDPGEVTGGLLVRQDFVELDIGNNKASALAQRLHSISDYVEVNVVPGALPNNLARVLSTCDIVIDATVSIAVGQLLAAAAAAKRGHALLAQVATDARTGTLGVLTVSAAPDRRGPAVIDADVGTTVLADGTLELYHCLWQNVLQGDELVPTRGCSAPTFHGSSADLAAVAGCLVNLIGMHVAGQVSGTHLIALPHSAGNGPCHRFIEAQPHNSDIPGPSQ